MKKILLLLLISSFLFSCEKIVGPEYEPQYRILPELANSLKKFDDGRDYEM